MSRFDIGNKIDRDRLQTAIKTSRQAVRPFQVARNEFIRDYVGSWYSKKGAKQFTYVNKMNQSARILSMWLAFNNPQVTVNSFSPKLWPFCQKWQVNINKVVANIDLKTTFQAGVLDAFFLMGIFKTHLADAGEVQIEDNVWIDPGKPWVDRISLDDAILDLSAKDIRAMRFCGNRYRVAYRKLRDRDDFDQMLVARITPTSKQDSDDSGARSDEIANGAAVDDDELEPMAWLEDIYIPETRQLCTLACSKESLPALRVLEDADAGPMGEYDFLGLGLVPDNAIPCSPAQNLKGLHDLSNRIYRKLSQQANRQKNTVAYRAGDEDDAKRGKDAVDGQFWLCRNPESLSPVNFPGVDGNTHAFFLAIQEVYNTQAGNERSVAGLGQEGDTLGQEQLIQGNATGMLAAMKGAVNDCAASICRKIGALMWDDEALTVESSMEAGNTGYMVDSSWRPGDREGIKDHYDFSVEPNSMGYEPPGAKLAFVMQFLQTLGTVYPLIQAGILDQAELTKFAANAKNVPELLRMFKSMPMPESEASDPKQATKAPVTSREVVRSGRPQQGPSGGGMAAVLGQIMQGGGQSAGATVGAA